MGKKCKYCGSSKHKSKACGLYRFGIGEKSTLVIGSVSDVDHIEEEIHRAHAQKKKKRVL